MEPNKENMIEWLSGIDTRITLSLTDRKMINQCKKLAENSTEVDLVENKDGSICCHMPKSYLRVRKPVKRELTEEQKEELAIRMRNIRSNAECEEV